ncbi:MAG: hypothetical protein JXA18_12435 [Chitinispirillaceae bacterium]|nr:hypothetical protein [Chitinispirillaceae bacterium]
MNNQLTALFYVVKPIIPRSIQILLRRRLAARIRMKNRSTWPILESASEIPVGWKGWPEKKQFAFVLSHDVDTQTGHDRCRKLMDLDESLGIRSTFNIVPERYRVSEGLIAEIKARGFGLGVHGLNHNGKLFDSYESFIKQAAKINTYIRSWGTRSFSSPSMHHRLEWMHHLDIITSTSTFDTDPFEPQPDAIGTIFPFFVKNDPSKEGFLEMPSTLPQDFTLFVILGEKGIDIWKEKIAWIASHNGMALLNTHPDYMNFSNAPFHRIEEYPVQLYRDFIIHLTTTYTGLFWNALPHEVAEWVSSDTRKSS